MHLNNILRVFLFLLVVNLSQQAKKQNSAVEIVADVKEFKKVLRTRTNVLVLYVNEPDTTKKIQDVFRETADAMKGQATLVNVQCNNNDARKICKKMKITADKPYYLKHYKDGDFHKDYDRSETVNSLSNFLRDPTGDLPWDEDPAATAVYHLKDSESIQKFLRKSSAVHKRCLIMFYAPWCGYCKILKPEYVLAAEDLKGEALLAAIDVSKPGNAKVRQIYNITGFPTLLYYERGNMKLTYNGENNREGIVSFMRDPLAPLHHKKDVDDGTWSPDTDVVHLAVDTFDNIVKGWETALVVFYAPWCGHCKRMKPEFEKAATRIKNEQIKAMLGAVDATKEPELAARFGVKGYPTLKYFKKGEYKFDASHAREEELIMEFVKNPQEPPPPPPPEAPWSEEESDVRHLNVTNFRTTLRKMKHAIVMFYAPWCGHCKSTKPEFTKAAEVFSDELMIAFGAVDCTTEQDLCATYEIKGYPTFKYFNHFDRQVKDYSGGRQADDFVQYIQKELSTKTPKPAKTNQAAGFGVNVRLSTDDDFEQLISSPLPSFIMFYASWCDHCVKVKPIFSKIATALKQGKPIAQAIAIDAAENPMTADFAGIQILPTFKLYAKKKKLADYTGDRSMEDMMRFIKKHAAKKDEL